MNQMCEVLLYVRVRGLQYSGVLLGNEVMVYIVIGVQK